MERKNRKISTIIGTCLLGTGMVSTIPFVATSCGEVKTVGNIDGTDWPGYISGKLIIQLNPGKLTAQIVDGSTYRAKNLQMPTKVRDSRSAEYTITSIYSGNDGLPVFDNGTDNQDNLTGTLKLPPKLIYLGASAFAGCYLISGTVDIPESVNDIREDAFLNCSAINKVNIENINANVGYGEFSNLGRGSFRGCNNLFSSTWGASEKISVDPATLDTAGAGGICYLKNKKGDLFCLGTQGMVSGVGGTSVGPKIVIQPRTVMVAYQALRQAWAIDHTIEVDFSQANSLTILPNQFCMNSDVAAVNLHNIEMILEDAFFNCKLTGDVNLENVKYIGFAAFWTYHGDQGSCLKTVKLGSKLTQIPSSCFGGQKFLETLDCSNISSVADHAFLNCTGLWHNADGTSGLTFSKKLTDLNAYAFAGWTNLPSLAAYDDTNMKFGVPYLGSDNIYYIRYAADDTAPGSTTKIPHVYALGRKSVITSTDTTAPTWNSMWSQVDSIANWAFEMKNGLTQAAAEITLNNNIKLIGQSVFKGCDNLAKVTLPGWTRSEFEKKRIGRTIFESCAGTGQIWSPDGVLNYKDFSLPDTWTSHPIV